MAQRWYKGNTHTHTTYSDGDTPPEVVDHWYAAHCDDFLCLTDHYAIIPGDYLARGPCSASEEGCRGRTARRAPHRTGPPDDGPTVLGAQRRAVIFGEPATWSGGRPPV